MDWVFLFLALFLACEHYSLPNFLINLLSLLLQCVIVVTRSGACQPANLEPVRLFLLHILLHCINGLRDLGWVKVLFLE